MNSEYIVSPADRILITGSNGFIGARVVKCFLDHGFSNLRCFVRPSSKLENLKKIIGGHPGAQGVEIVTGDLVSPEDCQKAAQDISVVIHLAAGFEKSFDAVLKNSVLSTQNIVEAFLKVGTPKRFVQVSSFAVYSNLNLKRGALLDESSPLEDAPQERHDAYGFGKLKQEQIVRDFGRTQNFPFAILRPGAVFGPGKRELTGRIGIKFGRLFLLVGGSNRLPLTYVDNCAEAIVLAALKSGVDGETFNVVDDDLMTSREFLRAYNKRCKDLICLHFPYFAAYWLCTACEILSKGSKLIPKRFNRRRCAAEWKGNCFSNQKLHARLGWKPRVPMAQGVREFLGQFGTGTV